MRLLATLLVPWPRPRLSSDRAAIADALRCYLLISSASCGLGGFGYGAMRCARRVYACRNCAEPTPACKIGCSTATGDRGLCCIADPQVSVPRDAASPLLKERMVESRSEKLRQRPRRYNRRLLQQYRHTAAVSI